MLNTPGDQFISALVKNLQAVCHGNVDFDKNVKVVGHLFLTVDSATEFNYIVNEKVSKSDESSTTFISKSFYATDPQQNTPKKDLDRSLPLPTTNDKTQCASVADKKDFGKPISSDLFVDFSRLSESSLFPAPYNRLQRSNPRRRSLDYSKFRPQEIVKRPCLSASDMKSSETKFSERLSTMTLPVSIDPESVSATPGHSLPGANNLKSHSTFNVTDDNIEHSSVLDNGSAIASGKISVDNESSVASSHEKNHRMSDPHPLTSSPGSVFRSVSLEQAIPPNHSLKTEASEEVDLSKVKQEILRNDLAEFGGSPEFLCQLRQKSIYPVSLQNNESCDSLSSLSRMLTPQSTTSDKDMFDIDQDTKPKDENTIIVTRNYCRKEKDFKSGSGSNHAGIGECFVCQLCGKAFGWLQNLKRHHRVVHTDKSFNCELCGREFRRTDNLKYHMIHVHGMNLPRKLTSWFQ